MATISINYNEQPVIPVDNTNIEILSSVVSECVTSYNVKIKTNSSVFVVFEASNYSLCVVSPQAPLTISSDTVFFISINTYQPPENSGITNNINNFFKLKVYDFDGGALIDSLEVDRFATNRPCKDLVFVGDPS